MINNTIIIAEAGVNHNGSLERALEMVDVAANAGADFVKFQTFRADQLVTKTAGKAEYQKKRTDSAESQYEMLKALELDDAMHQKLINRCNEKGISFMSTPFDQSSVSYLVHNLGVSHLKISSSDLTNPLVLLEAAKSGKNIILSTGMSSMPEIEDALSILAFGYVNKDKQPSRSLFHDAWISREGRDAVKQNVIILHCTTEYPTPFASVNLNAIATMNRAFDVPVGYSDHTLGVVVPVAAVVLGAVLIEKHFTLDKTLDGPDHAASLEPFELTEMVNNIRIAEMILGSNEKKPVECEIKNISIARKSLVADRKINKGELFTSENLNIKRPGTGITPQKYWDYIGIKSNKDYQKDELIE